MSNINRSGAAQNYDSFGMLKQPLGINGNTEVNNKYSLRILEHGNSLSLILSIYKNQTTSHIGSL